MPDKNKIYFPHLDGLRFICFISIFFFHSFATDYKYISTSREYEIIKYFILGNADLGVNFFFVLSGFLITILLVQEKQLSSTINIKNFYIRRILRIWPLFYFCVFFGFVIFPVIKKMLGVEPHETANFWYYIFFVNNFDFIKHGLPDCSVLGVLWSIAIEEQFYLLWPLVLFYTPKKKLNYVFFIIIIGSFAFRMLYPLPLYLDYHTLAVISDMAVGGLAAYYCYKETWLVNFFASLHRLAIVLLYLIVIYLYLFKQTIFTGVWLPFERLVMGLLFACIIMEQNYSQKSLFKMGNNKLFSRLGKYTYGMYCLHMIAILIVATVLKKLNINTHLWQVILLEGTLSFFLAVFLAYISYYFYEKKFLALKDKFN